jgi:hypothetical protein
VPTDAARSLLRRVHEASAEAHERAAATHDWAADLCHAKDHLEEEDLHREAAAADLRLAGVERALALSYGETEVGWIRTSKPAP